MMLRALPVFSVVFAVVYIVAVEYNLALFTYHPQTGQLGALVQPSRIGPAMYWYGWLLTALLAGVGAGAISLAVPSAWASRVWSGFAWLIPAGVILFTVYMLRGYFIR